MIKFHCCLNPERKVSEKAFEVHGFSDEFLSRQKKFKEVKQEFLEFIKNKTLIIHNAEFDIAHLNNELLLCKEDKLSNKVIDTLILAREKFPGSQVSLDALCKRYRIDNSQRIKHNALLDCELLREVYINLLDVKEPKFNLASSSILGNTRVTNAYNKNILNVSEFEIKLHKDFLKMPAIRIFGNFFLSLISKFTTYWSTFKKYILFQFSINFGSTFFLYTGRT